MIRLRRSKRGRTPPTGAASAHEADPRRASALHTLQRIESLLGRVDEIQLRFASDASRRRAIGRRGELLEELLRVHVALAGLVAGADREAEDPQHVGGERGADDPAAGGEVHVAREAEGRGL